jgi:hypothetical protein
VYIYIYKTEEKLKEKQAMDAMDTWKGMYKTKKEKKKKKKEKAALKGGERDARGPKERKKKKQIEMGPFWFTFCFG